MTPSMGPLQASPFLAVEMGTPFPLWLGAGDQPWDARARTATFQAAAAANGGSLSLAALGADLAVASLGVVYVPLTGDARIDAMLFDGRRWDNGTLTYSFPDNPNDYEWPYGNYGEPYSGMAQVSARQVAAMNAVLQGSPGVPGTNAYGSLESIAALDFVLTGADGADLRIAQTAVTVAPAWTYLPTTNPAGGDTWFVRGVVGYDFSNPILGDYFYAGHLHEPLHALGLKDGSLVGRGTPTTPVLPYEWDSLEFAITSYRSYVGAPLDGYRNEQFGFPQTPMMLDIQALQYLYGPNWNTNAGNTVYRWNPSTGEMSVNGVGQGQPGANRVFLTIWDGGGTDTYDMSNYAGPVSIDLAPGAWSVTSNEQLARLSSDGLHIARGNVFNALQFAGDPRALIENAIGGAGADTIRGNQGPNELRGLGGDDMIDGGGGVDTAAFQGPLASYTLTPLKGGGFTLGGGVADGTDTLLNIERLRFGDGRVTLADGDPLFDGWAYMKGNPDVLASGLEALQHFNAYGWHEGRDPNAFFDTADYLAANPDVRAAGVNPLDHYRFSGWREGRDPNAMFDTSAYLTAYADVQRAGVEPLGHYNDWGWKEGRDPSAEFDTTAYLDAYADVAAAGMNPLVHWLLFGQAEGRLTFGDGVLDPFP